MIPILQVIIENEEIMVHVQSGFLGHENDANCYRQIETTGQDAPLQFPDNCYILGDFIYQKWLPCYNPV